MEAYLVLSLLRLTVPLLIFRWPLLGIFASMYLDLQDFNYITIKSDQDMITYQTWDKFMDIYYLGIAFITTLSWKEKIAKKLSIILFSYRALGVFVLFFVHARELLLFFPNLFENFFIFYLLFKRFTNNAKLFTGMIVTFIILTSIIVPKLAAEFYLHVLLSPPLLNLPQTVITPFLPASAEDFVLYFMYLGPTILVLVLRIIYVKRKQKQNITK